MIPLRARGIVTLTKVVHGIPRAKMVSMIQEAAGDDGSSHQVLQDVLDLLMRLLADKDSFVYLAAIQSLGVLR